MVDVDQRMDGEYTSHLGREPEKPFEIPDWAEHLQKIEDDYDREFVNARR